MIVTLLAGIGGFKEEAVNDLLDEYREELYQVKYSPKFRSTKDRIIQKRVAKAAEEARLLRKVDAMSYSEVQKRGL